MWARWCAKQGFLEDFFLYIGVYILLNTLLQQYCTYSKKRKTIRFPFFAKLFVNFFSRKHFRIYSRCQLCLLVLRNCFYLMYHLIEASFQGLVALKQKCPNFTVSNLLGYRPRQIIVICLNFRDIFDILYISGLFNLFCDLLRPILNTPSPPSEKENPVLFIV